MLPTSHLQDLERSRAEILEAIGEHPDLVFIRGVGNRGDELISAGARRLLDGLFYREIGIEELPSASGNTALVCGGGAFCHSFHELMPRVLAMAELRFERVIVLPSTFDTSVDAVRAALRRSRALIFAREQESYRRIQPLCDARIAHDCAFYFDFEPYRASGSGKGVLNAFRTDTEAAGAHPRPPDSEDLSITAGSLGDWLRRIAAHERIRTDRAHVMIAAAKLGRAVEFAAGNYFKVPAIAAYSLRGFPVTPLTEQPPRAGRPDRAAERSLRAPPSGNRAPRVTAVIVSRERPEHALRAIDSVSKSSEGLGVTVSSLLVDNNSSERARQRLGNACAERRWTELRSSDRDLGRTGGRELALESTTSELVLILDDDAELTAGALGHLVSELDHHPEALAVSATVIGPDGRVVHSGGTCRESSETICFTHAYAGTDLEQVALPPSGPCDWMPGTAALVRRDIFKRFPLDRGMSACCEDAEWSLRVGRAVPGCFRRSREAVVRQDVQANPRENGAGDFYVRARVVERLTTAAHFHRRHGRLLRTPGTDMFALMPQLVGSDGALELARARILMELAGAHSSDWLLMQWLNGGLDPILRGDDASAAADREATAVGLQTLSAQLEAARNELDSAARQLDHAGARIETAESERDEAWSRLRRIYVSRLWRLGASYDRARRAARAVRSLGGGA